MILAREADATRPAPATDVWHAPCELLSGWRREVGLHRILGRLGPEIGVVFGIGAPRTAAGRQQHGTGEGEKGEPLVHRIAPVNQYSLMVWPSAKAFSFIHVPQSMVSEMNFTLPSVKPT